MNRRNLLMTMASLPIAGRAAFSAGAEPVVGALAQHVPIAGPDQTRYRLTLNRVLQGTSPAYTSDFLLEDIKATQGRRFSNFCGDLSGRWIGALATSAKTFGESFPALHDVVKRTIALQHADGYFGGEFHFDQPDDNDLALLWGNGRLLVGLLEYFDLTGEADVLAASRKLGDFLVRIAPRFNSQQMADAFSADHYASSYICWTQQTEGLALLYAKTQDERYRQLCAAIASRISRRAGDHVHGYLTSLRGVMVLYRETGDRSWLEQVVSAWQDIEHSNDLLLTGGVPERWSPKRDRTEGCAECDWLRLNLALYRATGERKYLDTAQNTYFNEFQMNQFATGDFGHGHLDARGVPQTVSIRAWWCCTLHGLRAFADLHDAAFRVNREQAFFELPIDSQVKTDGLAAEARSELTTKGSITIEIHEAKPNQKLTVTQPAWADSVSLTRNGLAVQGLKVPVVAKDVVKVTYGMKLRVEKAGEPSMVNMHLGPWLMGISSSTNPNYFNELYAQNIFDLNSLQKAESAATGDFAVPLAEASVRFAPAEFPEQPGLAMLQAVATQTGSTPQTWQLVFAAPSPRDIKAPPLTGD